MNFKKTTRYYWKKDKAEAIEELQTIFKTKYSGPIKLTGIEAEGMCPHHGLPTHYRAELIYIPANKLVVGTSKPYKVFRAIAAQPILAEDVFEEFWQIFRKQVKPKGLELVVKCKFECNYKDGVSRDAELILERSSLSAKKKLLS